MARATASAMRTGAVVAGVLLACSFGACAIDPVVIGAQGGGGPRTDGGTATGGAGGTSGMVGCTANPTPSTSPPDGYLSIDVNGTARQYILELPTVYDGTTPVPVLFAFHGASTDAQLFLGQGYGDVRAGAAGRVLLVGPNALVRNGQTAWVDPSGGQRDGVLPEDVDFFDALVAELMANYCIDAGRVFAMGHGDGAILSNHLACLRGDVIRGVGPFSGAGPAILGTRCIGKVAAFIGHNPKEGDPVECAQVSGGSCPWTLLWAETGWPTTQYWTQQDGCADPGAMPTVPLAGDGTTGAPPPCTSFVGCDGNYPVTLCLYDYWNQSIGPHAFPVQWGARLMTDFFLALASVP